MSKDQENTASDAGAQEPPQYRLTEPAYIDDRHYDQGMVDSGKAVIFYEGIPGAHMKPLNAAAKAMVKKHPPANINPIDEMTSLAPKKA